MVEMRLVIGTKSGKTYQLTLTEEQARALVGLKIGDRFKGEIVGLPGYEFEIRGGTDKDGFPMRGDLPGTRRERLLLASGPGYRPREKGVRRRKMIRGNTVELDIAQLNVKVVKEGKKKIEEFLQPQEEKTG